MTGRRFCLRADWRKKTVLVLAAAFVCLGHGETVKAAGPGTDTAQEVWSWQVSEEEEKALEEEILGQEGLDGEELSDQEFEQAMEDYLKQMGPETEGQERFSDKVTDPDLEMKQEEDGRFRYTLPNGNSFVLSAPFGMITSEGVELELPAGTVGILRKDDEIITSSELQRFTEKGVYHVRLLMFRSPGQQTADYNIYEVNFCFTIISPQDSCLGAVTAPEGFAIDQVKLDGQVQEPGNDRCYFLGRDGSYEILYQDRGGEGIFLTTEFVRDTRAPFLKFSPEPEPGGCPGPVEFTPSQPQCQVYISYNGNRGFAVGNVLTAAGSYELSVEDLAGNRRDYHLRIRQTYNLMDPRLAAAILVVAAAGAGRLVILRRNMRVL